MCVLHVGSQVRLDVHELQCHVRALLVDCLGTIHILHIQPAKLFTATVL